MASAKPSRGSSTTTPGRPRRTSAQGLEYEFNADGRHLEIDLDISRGWRVARQWWRRSASCRIQSTQNQALQVRVSLSPEKEFVWRETLDTNGEVWTSTEIGNSAETLREFGAPDPDRPPNFEPREGGSGGIRYAIRSGCCHLSVDIFDAQHALNEALDWFEQHGRRKLLFRTDHLCTRPFPDRAVPLLFELELEIRVVPTPRERPLPEYDHDGSPVLAGRFGSKRKH
jgi:hypothetical protein